MRVSFAGPIMSWIFKARMQAPMKLAVVAIWISILCAGCSGENGDSFWGISGKVVDKQTQSAIASAKVILSSSNQGVDSVFTDAAGQFEIGSPEARNVTLAVRHENYRGFDTTIAEFNHDITQLLFELDSLDQ